MYAKTDSAVQAARTSLLTVTTAKPADPVDTAWHPQRRVWGYAFGDAYYDQHSAIVNFYSR